MSETATHPQGHEQYAHLIARIRAGDASAMEQLYRTLLPGLRWLVLRSLGPQDTDDVVSETFCTALRMIKNGAVREPEHLLGYVRGIARIQIMNCIQSRMLSRERQSELDLEGIGPDSHPSPEELAEASESRAVAYSALRGLPERQRDVLVRFYLDHQSPEEICRDLGLTATQFRLLKSRAKKRFGQVGKHILSRKQPCYSRWRAASPQPALQTCLGNIS